MCMRDKCLYNDDDDSDGDGGSGGGGLGDDDGNTWRLPCPPCQISVVSVVILLHQDNIYVHKLIVY